MGIGGVGGYRRGGWVKEECVRVNRRGRWEGQVGEGEG